MTLSLLMTAAVCLRHWSVPFGHAGVHVNTKKLQPEGPISLTGKPTSVRVCGPVSSAGNLLAERILCYICVLEFPTENISHKKRNMIVVYRFRVSNVGLLSVDRNSYTDENEKALPTYLPTYLHT